MSRFVLAIALLAATAAAAADNTLLIQIGGDGRFVVWHTEGRSQLDEAELAALAASAKPEGGAVIETTSGPAQAFATRDGIVVELATAAADRRLLIDRDECGGAKLWHGDGTTTLGEDDLVELVLSALPGGGPRLTIGGNYARGYITRLGVIALLWRSTRRER